MKPDTHPMRRLARTLSRRASSGSDATRRIRRRHWRVAAAVLAGAATLAACAAFQTVDYYWQGAAGQFELLSRSEPIPDVIGRSDAALAARLARVREIRAFASRELGLPDNGSYTRYTDLGRPFVSWNVFATPELSLAPRQWCFPIAGCVNYRGYFREAEARGESARLRAVGDDVYVGGVPAYSTLGWFDDPVLSSFVSWPETEIARLIFHELAHQLLYVKNDSTFNESFAVVVEREGVRRWLAATGRSAQLKAYLAAEEANRKFTEAIEQARARLNVLYRQRIAPEAMRDRKQAEYAALKMALQRSPRFRDAEPNNALLASFATYTDLVTEFEFILKENNGDLEAFYSQVKRYAASAPSNRGPLSMPSR